MRRFAFALVAIVLTGCGGGSSSSSAPQETSTLVAAAGDISGDGSHAAETAALIEANPAIAQVITPGDDAYDTGTADEFSTFYDPTWGAFKAKTRPAPGNHDYMTSDAAPYYAYFGAQAGPVGRGYYSFDLPGWHVVSLNSEVDTPEQIQWLHDDLSGVPQGTGILAFWHRPLFNSGGEHGGEPNPVALKFWTELEAAHADVVLNGHEHSYQRYRRQDDTGAEADWGGIREFVVGTGGRSLYPLNAQKAPGFEFGEDTQYGVLELTLARGSYSWKFVGVGGAVLDQGGPVEVSDH